MPKAETTERKILKLIITRIKEGPNKAVESKIKKLLVERITSPLNLLIIGATIVLVLVLYLRVRIDRFVDNPNIENIEINEFSPNPNYNKENILSDS